MYCKVCTARGNTCQQITYELDVTTHAQKDGDTSTRINIFYPTLEQDILTEEATYTWSEILGFIGGTLGLTCGMSILSFLEILFVGVVFLLVKCSNVL